MLLPPSEVKELPPSGGKEIGEETPSGAEGVPSEGDGCGSETSWTLRTRLGRGVSVDKEGGFGGE